MANFRSGNLAKSLRTETDRQAVLIESAGLLLTSKSREVVWTFQERLRFIRIRWELAMRAVEPCRFRDLYA